VTNATELQGRYRIQEDIGGGGMGRVFAATDTRLGRRVAVKLLKTELRDDVEFEERFRREARAAASLSHRNIATIFDYGEDGRVRFMVMELVQGEDLGALLREESRLDGHRVAMIAAQIADALAYAHEAGVVHRDIKPSNVMIQEGDRVKVTDFGIARAAGDTSLTAAGSILGTVNYMSPEQARGEPTGPASDIYSLGVVLYEMLVGAVPFTSDSPVSVALRHVSDDIPAPSSLNPEVSPDLDMIVQRAVAKSPEARFATAGQMATALRQSSDRAVTAGATLPMAPLTVADTAPYGGAPVTQPLPAGRVRVARAWVGALAAVFLLLLLLLRVVTDDGKPPRAGGPTSTQRKAGGRARVPAVAGLTTADAEAKLRGKHLIPQVQVVSNPAAKGIALYTEPGAGSVAKKGATIGLFVSAGPAPPPKHPPDHHPKDEKKKKHGKGGGHD
jgi:eukaryotic-like serine/threonine-protein kinase